MYTFLNSQNSFLAIILRLQDLNTVENEWKKYEILIFQMFKHWILNTVNSVLQNLIWYLNISQIFPI